MTKTERENWEGDKNQRKEEEMEKREKRMERLGGGVLVDEEKRKES